MGTGDPVDVSGVIEALKWLPVAAIVAGPALAAGYWGHIRLGLAWPVLLCILGLASALSEPDNYDMHGLGLRLGAAAAAVALAALVAGAALRQPKT